MITESICRLVQDRHGVGPLYVDRYIDGYVYMEYAELYRIEIIIHDNIIEYTLIMGDVCDNDLSTIGDDIQLRRYSSTNATLSDLFEKIELTLGVRK